jgi:hypothetical protein
MPLELPLRDFRLLLRLLLARLLLRDLPLLSGWVLLRLAAGRRAAALRLRFAVAPREDCFLRPLLRPPSCWP